MREAQGPIEIPGTGPYRWQLTTAHYDYATAPGQCPICGGVGIAWRGWFHCDGTCHAIAVVEDGRTYVPVTVAKTAVQAAPCEHPRSTQTGADRGG